MSYIGNKPGDSYLTLEKQTFTTSATDTYVLDREVSGVNDIELFLNNVRQEPTEAYIISGTTLTLASAITSSDSMYCIYQGRSVGTQAPATGSVTNAMLAGSIANDKLANSSITLNGSAVSLGGSANAGITEADMWRLTTDFAGDGVLTSNLERVDTVFDKIGTGVSESSGIFSFPSTGIYYITFNATITLGSSNSALFNNIIIDATTDNSTYTSRAEGLQASPSLGGDHYAHVYTEMIFDVTNTSTHKVRFRLNVENSSAQTLGRTNLNTTTFTFIKLGDT